MTTTTRLLQSSSVEPGIGDQRDEANVQDELEEQEHPMELDKATFRWSTFLKFFGPGFMIGVGYLDPGNWATDLVGLIFYYFIAAGSQFGYSLLYVILIANAMAVVLQYLCIKLGTVSGNDLAMACRKHFPYPVIMALFALTEVAIIATDLAEVIGTAIALNLLTNLPLPYGVALTSLDVLLVLTLWGANHLRRFELAVVGLVGLVSVCFVFLLWKSKPDLTDVLMGFLPSMGVIREEGQLFVAVSIIGATIMPHNLYLHSSIVRYRSHTTSVTLGEISELPDPLEESELLLENIQPRVRKQLIPTSLLHSNVDSVVALCAALLVNSAILIVAAAEFHVPGGLSRGEGGDDDPSGNGVAELKDAYLLLVKHLGAPAGFAFALALFCAGQSSTITGTLAGQVVTEGFLGPTIRFHPAKQRFFTRILAIVPAMIAALMSGETGMNGLLIGSQVVLSLQLPFAIWPLVYVTCGGWDGRAMVVKFFGGQDGNGDGSYGEEGGDQGEEEVDYQNSALLRISAVVIAFLITLFNVVLIYTTIF